MKTYQQPQAHHWIIARLLVDSFGHSGGYSYNDERALSVIWMVKELGGKKVSEMLATIQLEKRRP